MLAGTEIISQRRGADTHFYLKDGQGSTRTLVNASGSILNTYGYHAFGDFYAPQTAGTTPNNYLYTGQQYDSLTGNYSLRARYYDPTNGRFLSQDKFPYSLQNPIELNRYSYAANNPTNLSDPTGYSIMGEYGSGNSVGPQSSQPLPWIAREVAWQIAQIALGAFAGGAGYILGLVLYNVIHLNPIQQGFKLSDFLESIVIGALMQVSNDIVGRGALAIVALVGQYIAELEFALIAFGAMIVGLVALIADMGYEGNWPPEYEDMPSRTGAGAYLIGNPVVALLTLYGGRAYLIRKGWKLDDARGTLVFQMLSTALTIAATTFFSAGN